jgi:hypothetical protein
MLCLAGPVLAKRTEVPSPTELKVDTTWTLEELRDLPSPFGDSALFGQNNS